MKTRTYRVPHPQHANMLVEMDVEEEEEKVFTPSPPFETFRAGTRDVSLPQSGNEYLDNANTSMVMEDYSVSNSPMMMEEDDQDDFANIGAGTEKPTQQQQQPLTDAQQKAANYQRQAIGRFPRLYIFAGMLANALGVDDLRQVLRHPGKGWGSQLLLPNYELTLGIPDEDKSTDLQYDFMLRSMFNAYTYGGLHRAYQRLRPEMHAEVTLRDLIMSPVTSDTFAAYCALLSKSSTGAFAQQGRMYNGGGGKIKMQTRSVCVLIFITNAFLR